MNEATFPQANTVLSRIVEAKWSKERVQAFLANWGAIRELTMRLESGEVSSDELQEFIRLAVLAKQGKQQGAISPVVSTVASTASIDIFDYFQPLTVEVAARTLVDIGKFDAKAAENLAANWHEKVGKRLKYNDPVIAYLVRPGFTLKQHAPLAGPCYENFGYLQNWVLENDKPTRDSVVFCVPRLVPGSLGKTVKEQERLREKFRKANGLPENQMDSFGGAALNCGLSLAHYKRTGEPFPGSLLWVRTDTLDRDGGRLDVGSFGGDGLNCSFWWDDRGEGVGFRPLGVVELPLGT